MISDKAKEHMGIKVIRPKTIEEYMEILNREDKNKDIILTIELFDDVCKRIRRLENGLDR